MPGRDGARKSVEEPSKAIEQQSQAGALVPFYGVPGIAPGIQAFRRGDIILYTVRGEPKKVLELMGLLDRQGVDEVVALISHHAEPSLPADEENPEPDESTGDRK